IKGDSLCVVGDSRVVVLGRCAHLCSRSRRRGGPMAEEVFKNVQILKGIPVDQFMGTMGFFSASLGLNCTDCHTDKSGGDWARYADENPRKQTARRMMQMVSSVNQMYFGGRQVVICNTCH